MSVTIKKREQGTFKRVIMVPADKLAEFEQFAKEKGCTIDSLSEDIATIKNMPRKKMTESELEEINKLVLSESKKYRHETFRYE